jgi:hypothetical protein
MRCPRKGMLFGQNSLYYLLDFELEALIRAKPMSLDPSSPLPSPE